MMSSSSLQGTPRCCIGMLSQLTTPWIPAKPSILHSNAPCDLPKSRCVHVLRCADPAKASISVELLSLRVCPSSAGQGSRSFHSVGAVKLWYFQGYGLRDTQKRWCSRPTAFVVFPNLPPSNLRGSRFFSSIRTASVAIRPLVADLNPSICPHSTTRVSRAALAEAQDALFEYLHGTRSLQFTDAEHISKNSPTFLQKLLAKARSEQETGRSLGRFLRYHPINEFEPFLESLGLKPSELDPLLPRKLLFLTDDDVMLQNFHVLCNYGVPRSNIGKMYMEATEIFRYDYGVLSSKLLAYEELGLSIPTVIKLVACCPSLLIGGVHGDFLQVFEKLKNSGIQHDWIRGCLSEKNTYRWDRMLKMLDFLDDMGCNKRDLERLVRERPGFLFDDSGKKIYVLVAMLLKLGLEMNDILGLFFLYPQILDGNYVKNLWQSIHFLFWIGMENKDISTIVCSYPQILGSYSLKKPEVVLSSLNVTHERLCEMIKEDPLQLRNLASKAKTSLARVAGGDHLQEKTAFLLKLGFVENSDEMTIAQKQFRGRGDQLQERFECLVNAGLDWHDVSNMVKGVPPMLNQCTNVLEDKIDYLVNHLGYPVESLLIFPTYLCYNLMRIRLRFSMYNWLKEKGAVKRVLSLSTVLVGSDTRFVKYVVNLHPEGLEEWERLKESFSSN